MFSAFFIRRPIFATVLSIVIVIMGLGAMAGLPVAQYPEILPPQISVDATYSGASATVVAETIAAPLENQINGATGLVYMNSSSSSDGRMALTATFETGTDPDDALVEINNRIAAATPLLPEEVRRLGVTARKSISSMLALLTLQAPDGRYDEVYLSNYALVNIVDELKRIPGVGNAQLFGLKYYSMRIWMDPDRMAALGMTPSEITSALRNQSEQLPAGAIGSQPLDEPVNFTYTMTTKGRLNTPDEFAQIVLRRDADGGVVRLKDVARVELGGQDYLFSAQLNGALAVPIGIFLSPGANALETMDAVKKRLQQLSASFPDGVEYSFPYDTTKFVRISIKEVVKTLFEAMALVFAVVFMFLGNWRATLIPSLAVPVSLIGTFAGMAMLGFLDQHADVIRPGARGRHRGRRRDRRARERRATDARGTSLTGRCNAQGDATGHRTGRRDRARPVRGVHPRRIHRRHERRHVPAVCRHHRRYRSSFQVWLR